MAKKTFQPENTPKKAAIAILEAAGWLVLPQVQLRVPGRTHKGYKGIPDLLAFRQGVCIGVEVKTATGKLSEDQERFAEMWFKAGMQYIVYREPKDLDTVLE